MEHDPIATIQAPLNERYRAYRDRYTPWPEDTETRKQAVRERLELDREELVNCDRAEHKSANYRRRVAARIASDERWLENN